MEERVELPPRNFNGLVWRVIDNIIELRAQGREEDAIRMVGELRDYAITFSKRRDIIYNIEKVENYIIQRVLREDIEGKEDLIREIEAVFAFSFIKPLSIQLLPTIKTPQVNSIDELLPTMTSLVNMLLKKHNAPFKLSKKELKKALSGEVNVK